MGEDFTAQLAWFRQGALLAGYRLEAQVGAGGMAVVFRARDERLGRLVALKVLAPTLTADEVFRRRFIAESRAAAAVDDPHIIPVYEAGEADGVLFIAMRYVIGGDLRRILEQEGTLSADRAAEFISPVASALDAAHRAGLVHRDVKPANILVDARPDRPDHVYLSDFGVSKGAVSSVSLTGTGHFLGTPDYSAPEQAQGLAVDGRADQYALACVAYQMLAGTVLFERDQGMAVLLAHVSEPPPSLRSRRPDLPGAADQVLARALAKGPENRYESCGDFADALRKALGLKPYHPRGTASAPYHPQTEVTSQPEVPGPDTTGAEKAVVPAYLAAALTIDSLPDRSPRPADLPPPTATVTGPAYPGARPMVVSSPAAAQRRTNRKLVRIKRAGYLATNARLIPNSHEIIDHLVVGPTGAYAIGSEKWKKSYPIRTGKGTHLWHGPFSKDERLDHARSVAQRASDLLSTALGTQIVVRPAIAIYGPKIPWDIATIRDVDVFSGSALRKYLRRRARILGQPQLTPEQIQTINDAAVKALPDIPSRQSPHISARHWLALLALSLLIIIVPIIIVAVQLTSGTRGAGAPNITHLLVEKSYD